MQVDIDWCGCGRSTQYATSPVCPTCANLRDAAERKAAKSHAPSYARQQLLRDLHRPDRTPSGFSDTKHSGIEHWRKLVHPDSSLVNVPRSPPSHLSPFPTPSTSRLPSPVATQHFPFTAASPSPGMTLATSASRRRSAWPRDSESLCPPATTALTTDDDSPIATPPSRSVVGAPIAIAHPTSRMSVPVAGFHSPTQRALKGSLSPPVVMTGYSSCSASLHSTPVRHQPAMPMDIPLRQSPSRGQGYYVYRPHNDSDDEGCRRRPASSNDDQDDAGFRAAPIVSRGHPLF